MSTKRCLFIAIVTLGILSAAGGATATTRLTYEDLLAHLTNLELLPAIQPGVYCRQFSSYDRRSKYDPVTGTYIDWSANADAGNYLRVDEQTKEGVMAEMEGPGCIFRIWSANPQGVIRFYLDGDSKPTYEWNFLKLCAGQIEPFIRPLVWKRNPDQEGSGSDIYLPIPFAKSCKVTSVILAADGTAKTPGHYYIIDYRLFPKDWKVDSFKLPLSDAQRKAVEQTAQKWANCGSIEAPPFSGTTAGTTAVVPGQTEVVVADLKGPSVIRRFLMKLKSDEPWATRKVVIRAYWDGQETPAINAPIGDFFGDPLDSNYKSYPLGITAESNYCFFPMPFHKSARIVLINEGRKPATVDYNIAWGGGPVPENWAYFHAKWRTEIASTSFDYPLLEATGTGKLVGICLFPHNQHGGWWGEGDEKVYVDGEKFPSWFGTGSEDYFGDAWGIRCFHNPSHGFPQNREGSSDRELFANYRWHLGDSIPFYKSFRMTIENYTGLPGTHTRNDYSSVAYWYQTPGGTDFFTDTPVARRVPREYVVPDAVEAEATFLLSSIREPGADVITDEDLPAKLSSGSGVKLVGKVGSTLTLFVPADTDENYIVELGLARDVKASAYEALIDGQKLGPRVRLKKGLNPLKVRFTGEPVEGDRCELLVDYFKVAVYRNFITEWMIVGPFANPERKGLDIAYPPESELDLAKKYPGRGGKEVAWQRVRDLKGIITLNDVIQPRENCVVYGACVVKSPGEAKRTVLLGSDDGVKVWLNGKLVWKKEVSRPVRPDEDRFDVQLNKGANTLLIKVEQGAGDLGWAVRFLDPEDELAYGLPE